MRINPAPTTQNIVWRKVGVAEEEDVGVVAEALGVLFVVTPRIGEVSSGKRMGGEGEFVGSMLGVGEIEGASDKGEDDWMEVGVGNGESVGVGEGEGVGEGVGVERVRVAAEVATSEVCEVLFPV